MKKLSCFQEAVSRWTEAAAIFFGFLLSWIYLALVSNIVFADWHQVLYNHQVHTPIATGAFATIGTMAAAGILGYLYLRLRPLKEMPPLAAVLSMSAMYIGGLVCALWTMQTCGHRGQGGVYLYLFPVNCILIAVKTIGRLLRQWQEQQDMEEHAWKQKAPWPRISSMFS